MELSSNIKLLLKMRIRAPRQKRLVNAAKRMLPVQAVFVSPTAFDDIDTENILGNVFYEDGFIFISEVKRNNVLWHDLCHAMVAENKNLLKEKNFGSTEEDEILTCKIEFWLGLVGNHYSYDELLDIIFNYSFDEDIKWNKSTKFWWDNKRANADVQSVISFIKECRKEALNVPFAKKLAEELKIDNENLISKKIYKALY